MRYGEWIKEHYAQAQEVTAGTGIFPEILLAQAIIESAKNGKMPNTNLSKKYKNYFGIKAGKNYKGKTVQLITGEYSAAGDYYKEPAAFRAYDSAKESFKDYVKVLKHKRYKKALAASTAEQQAAEIKKAGYSTAPDYAKVITALAQTIKGAAGSLVTAAKAAPASTMAAGALALAAAAYLLTSKNSK